MLTVFVLLACGVALTRVPGLPDGAARTLDLLVIWLALPAMILIEIPRLELRAETLAPVACAWGSLVFSAACVAIVGRLRGWDRKRMGTLLVVVPLGNTSFLGLAAVSTLLGPSHVGPALVYDQLGSFLALATYGSATAARYGSGAQPSFAAVVRRLVTFPPFVALVLALIVRVTTLPFDLQPLVRPLAAMLVPLAMLTVGMRLRWPGTAGGVEPLAIGLAIRMGLAPAAAYATFLALGRGTHGWDPASAVSVLEASMPPMVTAGIVASDAGLDRELAAALVGIGVLLSFATAPAWAALVQ